MSGETSVSKNLKSHLLTLASGTVISQCIPILALPVLSRLFSPESFGVFSVATSASAFLCVVVTLCYETGIVLSEDHKDASLVFSLVCIIASLISVVLLLLTLTLIAWHTSVPLPNFEGLSLKEVILVIISAWVGGVNQALIAWSNRHNLYRRIAVSAIVQQLVAAVARYGVGIGLLYSAWNGLFSGTVLGLVGSVICMLILLTSRGPRPHWPNNLSELGRVARKNCNFPRFYAPYSLLSTLSRDLPLYLLGGFGFVAYAGYLGFARSCVSLPVTFLSSSLGQVYLQRAANRYSSKEIEGFTLRIMGKIRTFSVPVFVGIFVWGPQVFEFVFGKEWREAGRCASLYAPVVFFYLFSSWLRIFEASGKQRTQLRLQVITDTATFLLLAGVLMWGGDPISVIYGYCILACAYHVLFVTVSFQVAGFDTFKFLKLQCGALFAAVAWFLIFSLLSFISNGNEGLAFILSVVSVVVYLLVRREQLFRVV